MINLLFILFLLFPLHAIEIDRIDFAGNNLIKGESLLSVISSYPGGELDMNLLIQDAEKISQLYAHRGLYHTRISIQDIVPDNSGRMKVIFRIEELPDITVDAIMISGNNYFSTEMLLEPVSSQRLDLSALSSFLTMAAEQYTERGFLFAMVNLDSLSWHDEKYLAYISVEEGYPAIMEEFKFKGNKVTRESTLLRISFLQNYQYLTPLLIKRAEENLRRKPYIKECRISPLNQSQVLFEITEDKMTLISGLLGYNNSENKESRFHGYINLEFFNLFGTDRSIAVYWQQLKSDHKLIDLQYHESGFTSIPISADFSLSREEVDSTYTKIIFNTDIYYFDLNNRYGIHAGLEQIFPGGRDPALVEKMDNKKIGIFWEFNDIDNLINPRRGNNIFLKYYNILTRNNGKTISKNAFNGYWETYRHLGGRFVGMIGLHAKIIENKSISLLDQFNLGGSRSLRGFVENRFSGYRIGWSNLELRYLLTNLSRTFLFFDYGYVENPDYRLGILFSIGLGLRVNTKLGLLGIDYGIGYSQDRFQGLFNGIVHFGIETKF
ncbi:MAG: BamA/TamA family outer membrane protein [Candidatus Cloacimonetes bacterium]|nr:BamA/TamA family outer membrane protein [Candidatus Cloacimonadota bacterium]